MTFKRKIVLLCIAPILLALLLVVIAVRMQTDEFVNKQVDALENQVMGEKRRELVNYVNLALTSIKPFLDFDPADAAEKAAATESIESILKNLTFENDGYFFVYDFKGKNIIHPLQTWRVGKNWMDLQDPEGKFVIKDLIERVREGGGFERYIWERPSTGATGEKYAYVVPIPQLQWMLGTGIYVDTVREQVNALRADVKARVHRLYWMTSIILGLWIFGIGSYLSILVYRETSLADERLHALNKDIISVQEEERRRVSRELHDGISQILITAKYAFALSQMRVRQGKENHCESFEEGFGLMDEAVNEVRRISQDLRPKALDDLGLAAALKMLVKRFQTATGISATISAERVNDALSDKKKNALYRITQEALTNIERHSSASQISVSLGRKRAAIILEIKDNGVGLKHINKQKSDNFGYGLGIANMEERLSEFDGRLTIASVSGMSGKGTVLRVEMPVEKSRKRQVSASQEISYEISR